MNFVDIHSHVLYGLDDGAKTLDESLEMLRLAAATGTTDLVATPHANSRYAFNPAMIDARIAELGPRTEVRIHRGCDFHLQANNIEDAIAHPDKYTINHLNYLLVEFSELGIFSGTDEILSDLVGAGMAPIITHPERNVRLHQRLDDIARWVGLGCYVQVTAGSCLGTFGKRSQGYVDELMERGLIHFVASDAHDCRRRSPSLREAYEAMRSAWGDAHVRPLFVDNPKAVLTGKIVDPEASAPPVRTGRWYQFWRKT
jgi:protein-tyrosine phosphatase